jgi:hypothetical protein
LEFAERFSTYLTACYYLNISCAEAVAALSLPAHVTAAAVLYASLDSELGDDHPGYFHRGTNTIQIPARHGSVPGQMLWLSEFLDKPMEVAPA